MKALALDSLRCVDGLGELVAANDAWANGLTTNECRAFGGLGRFCGLCGCGLRGIDRFAGRPISVDWRVEKELIRDSVFARRAG